MPVQRHQASTQVFPEMSEQDIDDAVAAIVSSQGSDIRAFQQASSMYNYDFFKDESVTFKAAACRGLKAHFSEFQNSFWDKASADLV